MNDHKDPWARFVADAIKGRHLHDPPDRVLQRAIDLGPPLERPALPSVLDCVRLLFDSAAEPLPAGVRGGATGPRRLLFSIGNASQPAALELDLQLRRRETGNVDLTGQLLPPIEHAAVELIAGAVSRSATMSDSGEFRFRNLRTSAAVAEIRIQSAGHGFTVTDVPLVREDCEGP